MSKGAVHTVVNPLCNPRITYNDELHRYTIDGKVAKSVTQILSANLDDFLFCGSQGAENLRNAGRLGSTVHEMTEHYDEHGDLPDAIVDELIAKYVYVDKDRALKYFDGWVNWRKHHPHMQIYTIDIAGEKHLAMEILIYSLLRRYCGRLDRVMIDTNTSELWMLDIKTSAKVSNNTKLQTAGYIYGFHEMFPHIRIDNRVCVQLNDDDGVRYVTHKKGYEKELLKYHINVFLCKLTSLQWDEAEL